MNRLTSIVLVFIFAFSAGGCLHSKKAKAKAKPTSAIAAEMEQNLRQRFIDRRVSELVAQGVAAEAAQARAAEEFKARYGYTSAAQK
jgi:hypothetical protein